MTGMPFLKSCYNTLPGCKHLSVLTGDCANPEPYETITEDTGIFFGRYWV